MKRLIYIIILLTSAIWFSSCRSPQYVPVETKIQLKDSVITRDSVVIKKQTVRKDSVVINDSLFSEKQKVVQVPYPVERELSWWQSVRLHVGEIAIGVIIGLIIIVVWLIRRRE